MKTPPVLRVNCCCSVGLSSLFLSCSCIIMYRFPCYTYLYTHMYIYVHTVSFSLPLSLTHTLPHTLTHTHSLSLSLFLSLSHTQTHMHTHTHTYTPMKTTLEMPGSPSSSATRVAKKSCRMISSHVRFRMSPSLPVRICVYTQGYRKRVTCIRTYTSNVGFRICSSLLIFVWRKYVLVQREREREG